MKKWKATVEWSQTFEMPDDASEDDVSEEAYTVFDMAKGNAEVYVEVDEVEE